MELYTNMAKKSEDLGTQIVNYYSEYQPRTLCDLIYPVFPLKTTVVLKSRKEQSDMIQYNTRKHFFEDTK